MALDVTDWLDAFDRPSFVWFLKRLAANDTLATQAHQAGPYVPRKFIFTVFPSLDTTAEKNPEVWFDFYIDSHADNRKVRAIYYNTRPRGEGTRDEARLTNFGGRRSALLDPDNTGALTVFCFGTVDGKIACHAWVCRTNGEEDLIEERIGPIEPGKYTIWTPVTGGVAEQVPRTSCYLEPDEIPPTWLTRFPTGEDIIRKTVQLRSTTSLSPDERLLRRRDCEFEIFQSVERSFYLPRIQHGFKSVEAFIGLAHSILQSRKSRSGNSLELHVREIFLEEGLRSKHDFQHRPVIENGKRPDFLFPSQTAYEDPAFPTERLRMLAAKTTCKDRWRQVINEADRIRTKHLLTLQEGVSEGQFREMQEAGIQLVVPAALQQAYPARFRGELITFEAFIGDVRRAVCA